MKKENLQDKFTHLHSVITQSKFLNMEALNGEIPFWISTYNPEQENEVNNHVDDLVKRLATEGIKVLNVNLFALSIAIIEEHMGMDSMIKAETRRDKERFKKGLQSTLNIKERFIPKIGELISKEEPRVLFVTGVSSVFPFIRSHTVLNNLQSAVTKIPILMFFPGVYTGRSLELFGLLKDDNYYRAFNIDQYKLSV